MIVNAPEVKTTCPYCGVGCGVIATVKPDGSVAIKGDPEHPANFGRLCSKGSALGDTVSTDGRLLHPEIGGRRTTWDEALDTVASQFSNAIRAHGPDSVAFYVSGQLLTEDYYVANKLMKGFIGSANIDTNSRLCMASSVAGHRRAFGTDTVPGTYQDLELADLVVLAGSNLAWCHPVLYQRIAAAKAARPDMKIVLIDPRRTMTADIADLHLAVRNDGDAAVFLGLLAQLERARTIDWPWVNAHVSGMDAALAEARPYTLERAAHEAGVSAAELDTMYRWFASTSKVVTVYSQGVNQSASGTDKVNAIINCHLATARIGRPGMGPFSVTGQPNAMGGREVGGLATMLAAHMNIEDPAHRDLVQDFWAAPAMADKPGLKAVDMFRAVSDGRIKALWIMSTNPVVSMPDADAVKAAIGACPFVVVSDILGDTDTARLAHVKLPATAWGEKNGTVTNSERRISRQRGFLPAPGEARPDWWHMAEVAKRMGFGPAFAWPDEAAVFAEHAALSGHSNDGTRDFDISAFAGVSAEEYEALAPFQWPQHQGETSRETRFFADGQFFTPDRRARAITVQASVVVEDVALRYTLNTGRVRDHWHTMTRTGRSAKLSAHLAEPYCEMHPDDAAALGIVDAGLVRVSNLRGSVILRALITPRARRGAFFAPIHWTGANSSDARIDRLVAPVTDPVSGQPASKSSRVDAERYSPACHGFAVSVAKPETRGLPYHASAAAPGGWRLEFALGERPGDAEAALRAMFHVPDSADHLVYRDVALGHERHAFFAGDRLIATVFISPEPVAVSRINTAAALTQAHADRRARFALVATRPGVGKPDPGAIVCSCFSVGVNQITTAIAAGASSVDAIGKATCAGTNCGSCKAEIGAVIARHTSRPQGEADGRRLIAAE
ncbi:MAG: nitrate reductase [Rhizobiaceae bacterium]|nr:nitrate reductase [Rhizobiaceae bacterium]